MKGPALLPCLGSAGISCLSIVPDPIQHMCPHVLTPCGRTHSSASVFISGIRPMANKLVCAATGAAQMRSVQFVTLQNLTLQGLSKRRRRPACGQASAPGMQHSASARAAAPFRALGHSHTVFATARVSFWPAPRAATAAPAGGLGRGAREQTTTSHSMNAFIA